MRAQFKFKDGRTRIDMVESSEDVRGVLHVLKRWVVRDELLGSVEMEFVEISGIGKKQVAIYIQVAKRSARPNIRAVS